MRRLLRVRISASQAGIAESRRWLMFFNRSPKLDGGGLARKTVMAVMLLALPAACAGTVAPAPVVDAGVRGRIVTVRPVPAAAMQTDAARLLGGDGGGDMPLSEFIVRTMDGRLVSVVQPSAADLTAGADVAVRGGDRPRLERLR
jgi:hypothetical protein